MKDPYETLGLARDAKPEDVKRAFKRLARKHHPDLHPGDPGAEARFKEITAAHDLLSDPETRRRFDAGEIDATGAEKPRPRFWRDFADAPPQGAHAAQDGFASREELEAFLARAFGGRARGPGAADFAARGEDVAYTMATSFLDAATGATRTITLPDGRTLRVSIPEGARDGQTVRLRGQGGPGFGGGPPGDAYVELRVEPHAFFRRKDDDIHLELPVSVQEAVLGAVVEVPTIDGPVKLTIPPGSNAGRVLRLRGKGVRDPRSGERGHQFVTLKLVLPPEPDPAFVEFLRGWTPARPFDPRRGMTP